jgi:hypothetical protein
MLPFSSSPGGGVHIWFARNDGVAGRGRKSWRRRCRIGDRGAAGLRSDQPIVEAVWSGRSIRDRTTENGATRVEPRSPAATAPATMTGSRRGRASSRPLRTSPKANRPGQGQSSRASPKLADRSGWPCARIGPEPRSCQRCVRQPSGDEVLRPEPPFGPTPSSAAGLSSAPGPVRANGAAPSR